MNSVMPKLPKNYEELIGTPQVIARSVEIEGLPCLVRLQRPFEEAPFDNTLYVTIKLKDGKPHVETKPKSKQKDESYLTYGTALLVECWSDATKSVVTVGFKRVVGQSDEEFSFGVRYMLNHASDAEIVQMIKAKRLDIQLKYQCGEFDSAVVFPSLPRLEKKKPDEI